MALKTISNSLVLSRDDSTYLDRSFGVPTDSNRWTLSLWFKRARNIPDASVEDTLFSAGADASNFTHITFEADDTLRFHYVVGGVTIDDLKTEAQFRDPTAWYHLVIRYNSDEVTSTVRIRFWVDNIQITDFTTSNLPTLGADSDINISGSAHEIGRAAGTTDKFFDGYLAEIYFCDGQSLSPTNFAEDNNGTWQPIVASPTFGSNGFFLEFGTAADLGDDTSGNTNDWTENIIVAANQRTDTPTRNHLTWNNQYFGINDIITLRNGSREMLAGNTSYVTAFATAALPKTGKYYWEVDWAAGATAVDKIVVGVVNQLGGLTDKVGNDNHGWGVYNPSGTVIAVRHDSADTTFTDTGAFVVGDYLMVAFDTATGNLWFGKNGTWFDSGDPGAGTNPAVTLTAADIFGDQLIPAGSIITATNRLDFRAGLEDFEGSIPTGFNTLDITTWPDPPVTDPKDFFDLVSYTGDDVSGRSFTGFQFQPDIVWIKSINFGTSHRICDAIIGAGNTHSNDLGGVDVAVNPFGEVSAFNSDGFTVVANTNLSDVNRDPRDYIGFCWKEDVVAGLDLVGYVGAAAPQAISHNLGDVPGFIYARNRDTAGENLLYHENLLDTSGEPVTDPETDHLEASTAIIRTDDIGAWNDTAPTTTQFTVGSLTETNTNLDNHAAYVWREIEGLSKFVSYVGTGTDAADAPFIYCGFRPKLVFIKRLDVATRWNMFVRDNDNISFGNPGGTDARGSWDSDAEFAMAAPIGGGLVADMCASGFKLREVENNRNTSGSEYLVMAWAEIPFKLKSAIAGPVGPGAGAIDLKIDITATGDDPNQFGDGAPDLSFLISATGSGGLPKGAGTLDMDLEIFATGSVAVSKRGDGALDLAIEIDSQAFNTAIRGPAVTLPQLTTTGVMEQSTEMLAPDITLPQLQMGAVTILNANPIFGNLRIPVLQTGGEINPDFDVELPLLEVSGVVLTGTTIRGVAIPLPVLQITGSGISPPFVSGNLILPQLATLGSTIAAGAAITALGGSGAMTIPALGANGFLLIPQELAGTILLPALDLDPLSFLAPGAIVAGSVTLPLLRLGSILVNGATLTATVWAMNTETFETTNYLNFDFDSLVSFNEQPYGVTSSGIFLLEGDDDAGTDINARVLTGISDRGDENLSEVAHLYLQYEGQAVILQLFPDGQQRIREYEIVRRSNSSGLIHARAKGARGLRSRSWQMGFRNLSGGDFTFDKMGLLIRQLTRKTRKN